MMERTYTCDLCHGEFISDWTEAEAEAEAQATFGSIHPDDRAVLCDDCYAKIMPPPDIA